MAPKTGGEETRREVAVIKDGVDAGGSYVFVQRWEHNLKQLNRMSVPDQEMMIGRTKTLTKRSMAMNVRSRRT